MLLDIKTKYAQGQNISGLLDGYEKCNQMIDKITDIIERKIRIRNDLKIWKRKKFIIWIPENNEKKNV